jgi:hypothetical protein
MSETQVVCVGEVIIELARVGDGRFAMSCGGDTFNTAIYVARAGLRTAFASALGDDPYSNGVLALASAEGVASDMLLRVPGRLPGLALVEVDAKGKRHFHFWRAESPARELFELPEWSRLVEGLLRAKLERRAWPLPGSHRACAPAGRQDRVRRQFPGAWLAGRLVAHARGVHGGAQARRHRAAYL